MTPLLRNWESSPPPGGWGVKYSPIERPIATFVSSESDPKTIVADIVRWRTNNGLPPNESHVWDFCNLVWCQRDPKRCLVSVESMAAGAGRRTLTPIDYGPWSWKFLNTFGVHFDHSLFMAAIWQIEALLDPTLGEGNYGSGCANCASHFKETQAMYPPAKVKNREEASVWVYTAHDLASKSLGRNKRPEFMQIALEYGWQPLSAQRIRDILNHLRA